MELQVVCLYDSKALAYNLPQFVQSVGAAVRSFSDEVNRADAGNVLFNHPADFLLFHMGTYDDATGVVSNFDVPRQIAIGNDLKRDQ